MRNHVVYASISVALLVASLLLRAGEYYERTRILESCEKTGSAVLGQVAIKCERIKE